MLFKPQPNSLVIPAQAGIYHLTSRFTQNVLKKLHLPVMDSRLRGNDELGYRRRMKRDVKTAPYHSADYLDSEAAIVTYLKVAFEEGEVEDIRNAINNVARVLKSIALMAI